MVPRAPNPDQQAQHRADDPTQLEHPSLPSVKNPIGGFRLSNPVTRRCYSFGGLPSSEQRHRPQGARRRRGPYRPSCRLRGATPSSPCRQ
ncbi:hypothetical protein BN381_350116 [Candidatus Microthrix parvicella RN1]|uniref:Uncharacterized protein n=1 Tax=Candidatus Neomicrothrix parvicella RN1 TaxID=1229780 RepID=R4Z4N7_9ACTN|nr:hypothetical protein BN381_350116 [Candidatus Microthrix parvicella RN1]